MEDLAKRAQTACNCNRQIGHSIRICRLPAVPACLEVSPHILPSILDRAKSEYIQTGEQSIRVPRSIPSYRLRLYISANFPPYRFAAETDVYFETHLRL